MAFRCGSKRSSHPQGRWDPPERYGWKPGSIEIPFVSPVPLHLIPRDPPYHRRTYERRGTAGPFRTGPLERRPQRIARPPQGRYRSPSGKRHRVPLRLLSRFDPMVEGSTFAWLVLADRRSRVAHHDVRSHVSLQRCIVSGRVRTKRCIRAGCLEGRWP